MSKLISGVADWIGGRGHAPKDAPHAPEPARDAAEEPQRQPAEHQPDLELIDLDAPPDAALRAKIEPLAGALGWDHGAYLSANPDLARMDSEGGAVKLFAHFLQNGVPERRRFSEAVKYATEYTFEHSLLAGEYLLCIGWSETPLRQPRVVMTREDGTFAVPAAHIGLYRDDVAKHLGRRPREKACGFLMVAKAPAAAANKEIRLLVRDGGQLLVARLTPAAVQLDEWLRTAFRLVEERMTYEEMVRAFGEHYAFLELLREAMAPVYAEAPGEFSYPGPAQGSVELSVCAVLLGKAILLKPFMASLLRQRPANARWEVLLLANAGLDLDNIKAAAEWCSEVYGIDVTVFAARNNLGFGGGMNLLAARARGRVTMMTNIDVRFTRLELAQLEEDALGGNAILAAYQFNPSGSLQHEGLTHDRRKVLVNGKPLELLDTRLLGRNTYPERLERKEVEYFGAACVLGATAALQALGPFSTAYFYAYHEDCDFARRARAAGMSCLLSPALQIVHYESSGASSIAMPLRALNAANLVTFMRASAAGPSA
jgi:hypothetical protein